MRLLICCGKKYEGERKWWFVFLAEKMTWTLFLLLESWDELTNKNCFPNPTFTRSRQNTTNKLNTPIWKLTKNLIQQLMLNSKKKKWIAKYYNLENWFRSLYKEARHISSTFNIFLSITRSQVNNFLKGELTKWSVVWMTQEMINTKDSLYDRYKAY